MSRNKGEGRNEQKKTEGKGRSGQVAPTRKHAGEKKKEGKSARHNDAH
jgi:hypothetical protein